MKLAGLKLFWRELAAADAALGSDKENRGQGKEQARDNDDPLS